MADFNFTVQDLFETNTGPLSDINPGQVTPFIRENTKDLATGQPLNTSGSFAQTNTFNPVVGSSVLSVGELLMGPSVFGSSSGALTSATDQLSQLLPSSDTPQPPSSNSTFAAGSSSSSSSGSSSSSSGSSTTTAPGAIPASSSNVAKIQVVIQTAIAELGVPYQWGGGTVNGPTLGSNDGNGQVIGFDCSGLMLFCFDKAGLLLPRTAQEQHDATTSVDVSTALPGDMLFFGTSVSGGISHVGLCIGNNNMIDAPESHAFVRQENYHWSDLIAATRPFPLPAGTTYTGTT